MTSVVKWTPLAHHYRLGRPADANVISSPLSHFLRSIVFLISGPYVFLFYVMPMHAKDQIRELYDRSAWGDSGFYTDRKVSHIQLISTGTHFFWTQFCLVLKMGLSSVVYCRLYEALFAISTLEYSHVRKSTGGEFTYWVAYWARMNRQ